MRVRHAFHTIVSALALAAALIAAPSATARTAHQGAVTATIGGTVQTIDAARKNVTIKTSAGTSVTLAVPRRATILRNGVASSLVGLTLNDSVTVEYRVSGLAARTLNASGPAVGVASGRATQLSFASGSISMGGSNVQTNANTKFARNGSIVALRQLTLSDTIVAHTAAGTNVALDVLASGPESAEVHGIITAIAGNNVTIKPDDGSGNVTIVVGAATLIEVNDHAGALADLQVGQEVEADYYPTTFDALKIEADTDVEEAEVEGTVAAVDTTAGKVTITPKGGGPDITLMTNSSTKFRVNDAAGTLADVQVGMSVEAEYDPVALLALKIKVGAPEDEEDGDDNEHNDGNSGDDHEDGHGDGDHHGDNDDHHGDNDDHHGDDDDDHKGPGGDD